MRYNYILKLLNELKLILLEKKDYESYDIVYEFKFWYERNLKRIRENKDE